MQTARHLCGVSGVGRLSVQGKICGELCKARSEDAGAVKQSREKADNGAVYERHHKRAPIQSHRLAEETEGHDGACQEQCQVYTGFEEGEADAEAKGDGFYEKVIDLRVEIGFEEKRDREGGQKHADDEHRNPQSQCHTAGCGHGRVKAGEFAPQIQHRAVNQARYKGHQVYGFAFFQDKTEQKKHPRLDDVFRLPECDNAQLQTEQIGGGYDHGYAEIRRCQYRYGKR